MATNKKEKLKYYEGETGFRFKSTMHFATEKTIGEVCEMYPGWRMRQCTKKEFHNAAKRTTI